MLVYPSGIPTGSTGYVIENSIYLNGSSQYLSWTLSGAASDPDVFSISMWIKRPRSGVAETFIHANPNISTGSYEQIKFNTDDIEQQFYDNSAGTSMHRYTTGLHRDPTAWFHFIFRRNGNTGEIIINGATATTTGTDTPGTTRTFFTDPGITVEVGRRNYPGHGASEYAGIYVAEVQLLDGVFLDPTDVGEYDSDSGIWIPKEYSGTYGNNGFKLNFSDSSSLGADTSGNGNNFTVNGSIATTQQVTDTPTDDANNNIGNYLILNPLNGHSSPTISEGNTRWARANGGANNQQCYTTFGATSGKFYFEFKLISASNGFDVGLFAEGETNGNEGEGVTGYDVEGYYIENYGTGSHSWKVTKTSSATGGSSRQDTNDTAAANDICKIAVDFDAGKIWLGSVTHNTYYSGSDGSDISFSTSSPTFTFTAGTRLFPYIFAHAQANDCKFFFNPAEWTGSAPSGFLPWITANLPAPTIKDPNEYFGMLTWNGTGSAKNETGLANAGGTAWTPDFVWIKERNDSSDHALFDCLRSEGTRAIRPSNTTAQDTDDTAVTDLISGGVALGDNSGGYNATNRSGGKTYVAWCMLAGGEPSASDTGGASRSGAMATDSVFKGGSNFSFTPASGAYYPKKMSIADHRGFSIVTWTGDGTNSDTTIPHGLDGAVEFVITKNTNLGTDWLCKHKDDGLSEGTNLRLNETSSTSPAASGHLKANGLTADTFEFDEGNSNANNFRNNNEVYMAYCFRRTPGLIGIGKYIGNTTSHPYVVVDDGASGFRPAWVMIKRTDSTEGWHINDAVRDPINPLNNQLQPQSANPESGSSYMDFTANGFKLRGSQGATNANGGTYVYLAFAEHPFGGSGVAQARAR